jgi:hypothetical protein
MTKDDGGLVFPSKRAEKVTVKNIDGTTYDTWETVTHPGMTLRDWFAGQALAGIAPAPAENVALMRKEAGTQSLSEIAYAIADAMIAERNK